MDWDTWIGIADMRPYSSKYAPFEWRGWYDFGCGALGDMACHILGSVNMALLLDAPTHVEVLEQTDWNAHTFANQSKIRLDFPARKGMPAVKVFWYDGAEDAAYTPEDLKGEEAVIPYSKKGLEVYKKRDGVTSEQIAEYMRRTQRNGALFVGAKGYMATDTYANNVHLLPSNKWEDYESPDPLLTRSPGHYRDWIRAAKGGDPACSDFSIAGPFTEWILVGALALRLNQSLDWDVRRMKTNSSKANEMLKPTFRSGWTWT